MHISTQMCSHLGYVLTDTVQGFRPVHGVYTNTQSPLELYLQVISRSAPEAAAVVLSQMASRLLNARRVRMRASAGKRTPLRPFAPVGTHSGDSFQANFASPETPSDRRTPRNTPNAQSTFVDQKGNIVTIAIVPAGSPPRNLKPNQQRSAVRR